VSYAFELLEPEAASRAESALPSVVATMSSAISLKRIADILEGKVAANMFTAPINVYGEGIGEAIQNQIERGQRGISSYDR
jgi:hypothetical protein